MTLLDEEELVKSRVKNYRGPVPRVLLKAMRVCNKKVTTIEGLGLYQIEFEEFLTYLSHKCAGSTIMHNFDTVQVQGQHLSLVQEILVKRYKVPQKYIDNINNIESKKKKK